jgi:hypothetical protein
MAFTGNFVCTSFKVDLLCARHNFLLSGGNTFKIALYTNSASFTAATTAYTATNEVSSSGTAYTTTGNTLTRVDPTFTSTTAFTDFADSLWSSSTITARGAMIYNDTLTTPVADASVVILDFGSDKSSSSGDFTVVFPAADSTNAIIRIA